MQGCPLRHSDDDMNISAISAEVPVKSEPQFDAESRDVEFLATQSTVASGATPPTVRMARAGRGLALAILATVAVVFALERAQSFIISLLIGILFAYTLNPLVVWLERIRVPPRGWHRHSDDGCRVCTRAGDLLVARTDADHSCSVARSSEQIVGRPCQPAQGPGQYHAEGANPGERVRKVNQPG